MLVTAEISFHSANAKEVRKKCLRQKSSYFAVNASLTDFVSSSTDCDYDEECAGDLRCFQREAGEAVPGCDGNWGDSASFCYSGTESFLTNRNDADKPFGECEG